MFRLDGKIAMVTGAATGLEAAISKALATQGADIAISDLPGQSLSETGQEIRKLSRRSIEIEMDVREIQQLDRGVAAAHEAFGHVDILVNNAGINRPASGLQATASEWDDHFATNVKGGFFSPKKWCR
jgi:NAD(P)-dependent dehydrogenase (short-subunit alcohol dehydrogenase family)